MIDCKKKSKETSFSSSTLIVCVVVGSPIFETIISYFPGSNVNWYKPSASVVVVIFVPFTLTVAWSIGPFISSTVPVTLVWANKNVPPKRAVRKNIFLSDESIEFKDFYSSKKMKKQAGNYLGG